MKVILYQNGIDFYQDNQTIIENNLIETAFFKMNYQHIDSCTKDNYAIKISNESESLIALQRTPYNLLVFGSTNLVTELVKVIISNDLNVNGILTSKTIANFFIDEISKYHHWTFKLRSDMSILTCNKYNELNTNYLIETPSNKDLEELKELQDMFHEEIFHEASDVKISDFEHELSNYLIIRLNDSIVSMIKRVRDEKNICSLSFVYTRKEYRFQGIARILVTSLTNAIVKENKLAYLFVDNNNPISNHLYKSIGYIVKEERLEYICIK